MSAAAAVTPPPTQGVWEGEVGGSRVLFNRNDRRLHVLNASAASLWDGLQTPTTVATLTADIAQSFEVDPASIRMEVERTIDRFVADGLAGSIDEPSAPITGVVSGPVGAPAVVIGAMGATIGLFVEAPMVRAALERVTAPLATVGVHDGWIAVDEDAGAWTVTSSLGASARTGSRLGGLLRVISEINAVAVAACPERLVLHAGAVTSGAGAVLLPGASNRGKSTLTTALVRSGFGYLTDEAAAVDADRVVHPFAKAIALDPGSFPLFGDLAPTPTNPVEVAMARREWHVPPADIGAVDGPTPVRAVVCPAWRAGVSTRLARVPGAEALHMLLGDAFDFDRGGAPVFDILTDLVRSVPVYRLRYSELSDAVRVVGRVLDAAP
ncbi:MAG: PqqD family peptide modification chaperone [Actinomycetota bacterium]